MATEIQHWIRYSIGGRMLIESDCGRVETRDIDQALANLPRYAFAFCFYDVRVETMTVDDTGEPVVRRTSENYSAMYYPGAEIFSADEIAAMPNRDILARNIVGNDQTGVPRGIRCRLGNWQQFEEGDIILSEKPSQRMNRTWKGWSE